MSNPTGSIRKLPLHQKHTEFAARFGAFGEWEVPIYYTSVMEEHAAVRSRVGAFDISHMGEFTVEGSDARDFLQGLLPRDIARMRDGQAWYMPMLNERGGIVDDIILYRSNEQSYWMIVNAGNVRKDFEWIRSLAGASVELRDRTEEFGLIALQGPRSGGIITRRFGRQYAEQPYYFFQKWDRGLIARTGYTGEDGFEIMVPMDDLTSIWDDVFEAGKTEGIVPVGFGARDTLRLEAGMLLYGQDMDDETNPLEAGLQRTVDFSKSAFVGKQALMPYQNGPLPRQLVGIEMIDRGIPRHNHEITKGGKGIGQVTSGSFSPTLKKNIAMGYIASGHAQPGNEIEVVIRDNALKARIVPLPFYKRTKPKQAQ